MGIEQTINQKLNQYPEIKKIIKRVYQRSMYLVSPKIISKGDISRVSPQDPAHEFFFGYYDKSPEDMTGRYVLCLKADNTWTDVAPANPAQILLIDKSKEQNDPERFKTIGQTCTWNVQQGCMLQWLGPAFDREILFNDFRDGRYCSVILDIASGQERVLGLPVYSVSSDGSFALSLDFARLHRLRPGYGYSNLPDSTAEEKIPTSTAIWKLNIQDGTSEEILSYTDFALFEHRPEMTNAEHKVNHIMINPSGTRFMVLHRWFDGHRKYSRLITANIDGTDMYNLSDDDMISHCCWKDDQTILAFENKNGDGAGYYLMKDKSTVYKRLWPSMTADGHPSYSPDGEYVVTDTYPNRARVASIKVMRREQITEVAKVFAPFRYDNETRCDLHPRWSRDGKRIYFDSVFEGRRGLYTVPNSYKLRSRKELNKESMQDMISVIVPVYNVESYLQRCVDSILEQSYTNLEVILVDDGSTDSSSCLCDDYKSKDNRIIVIHKENGGLSSARNAGLEVASGQFISFVDSDDWIEKDTLLDAVQIIQESDVDLVDFRCIQVKNSEVSIEQTDESIEIYEGVEILRHYLFRGMKEQNGAPFSSCRKVYRADAISDIRFEEGSLNEDICFVYRVLQRCHREAVSNLVKYFYFQREKSITSGRLRSKNLDLLKVCDELVELARESNDEEILLLARMKRARSDYSLLARAAIFGIDGVDDIYIKEMVRGLRHNCMMLMKSPMQLKRKMVCLAFSINYKLCANLISIARNVKK